MGDAGAEMPTIIWSGAVNASGKRIEVGTVTLNDRQFTVAADEPKFVEPEDLSAVTSQLTAIGTGTSTVVTRSW